MKRKDQRIARAILASLAAGSMTGVLGTGDASAMTLDEYKQALAEGKVLVDYRETNDEGKSKRVTIGELNQKNIKQARVVGQAWISVDLQGGDKANAMELRTSGEHIDADGNVTVAKEGGEMTFSFGADYEKIAAKDPNGLKDTDAIADMRNVTFKSDDGAFHLYNGTVIARPENIYGHSGSGFDIGTFIEGNSGEKGTALERTHPTLKLEAGADSHFNTEWQDEVGNTYHGSNFIHLNKNGTIEAPSALIFRKGLGEDGLEENPDAMRADAQNALDFKGGTLALDDLRHNDEYLLKASDLLKDQNLTIRTVNGDKRSIIHVGSASEGEDQRHEHFTASAIRENGILRIRDIGQGWTTLDLQNGDKLSRVELAVGEGDGPAGKEGGIFALHFGSPNWNKGPDAIQETVKNTEAVADLTDVTFNLERGHMDFFNGTIKALPKNFKGGKGYLNIGTDMTRDIHATLHLVGDSDLEKKGLGNKALIQLNPNGTLRGKSKLFFTKGLIATGTNENPEGLRKNFTDNVMINGGRLVLDDGFYNDAYLEKAKGLIQAQNSNATVEMWNGARKTLQYAQWVDALGMGADAEPSAARTTEQNITTTAGKIHNIQTIDFEEGAGGEKTHKVTVTNGTTLNLGYKDVSGDFITVNGEVPSDETAKKVSVVVEKGGELQLGRGDKSLIGNTNADISLAASEAGIGASKAKLKVVSGQQTVRSVQAKENTSVTVDKDALLKVKNGITLEKNATLDIEGSIYDTVVNADDGVKINIGNNNNAGKLLLAQGSKLTNADVFLDPNWINNAPNHIENASKFVNPSAELDYRLTVGRNSVASLGADNETVAEEAFEKSGKTWGEQGITAALYLGKHLKINATGGVKVDGSLATGTALADLATAGNITFKAKSLLIADAAAFTGPSNSLATGTETTTISVDPTSRLQLTGILTPGIAYNIINGTTIKNADPTVNNWLTKPREENVILPKNYRFSTEAADADKLVFRRVAAVEAMPQGNRAVTNIVDAVSAVTSSTSPYYAGARKFVSVATNPRYSDVVANAGVQPAEAAGVSYMAMRSVFDLASDAQQRLSFLNADDKIVPQSLWVKYGHSHVNVDGLNLEGMDANFDGNTNSITIGYDFAGKNKLRGGIAASYVKGSTSGRVENNDLRMGGVHAYAGLRNGNNNLLFDIGAYKATNEVDGFVSADADLDLFTLGVTHETRIASGNQVIIPHIGLRWTSVDMGAYDGYCDGQMALRYEPGRKSLVTLPVGVGIQSVSKSKDWTHKFYADLSYIAALGGTEADMRVSVPGVDGASGVVHYDIHDQSTIAGSIGVNAESKTMSWGIGYQYRHSDDSDSHNLMAQLNFRF